MEDPAGPINKVYSAANMTNLTIYFNNITQYRSSLGAQELTGRHDVNIGN